MNNPIFIREITDHKGQLCDSILRSLPKWFGIESAIVQYVSDIERMPMLATFIYDQPVGFVAVNLHNAWTAEIHIMGIREEYHRQGIGRRLIEEAEAYLSTRGYEFISVKTLSESRENEEYAKTRNFYFSLGFRPVEEFKTLWGEANPCLLMIKKIEENKGDAR